MREETEHRPKPMVEIGGLPVIVHLMNIYSSQGVQEFVILAGYKARMIKEYFLNFVSNTSDIEITYSGSEANTRFVGQRQHTPNWKVTILDTGAETLTGERLLRAKEHIGNETFFATYGDGLAPVNLQVLLDTHKANKTIATLTATRPKNRFGVVQISDNGLVNNFQEKPTMTDWTNIGFFCFEPEVFSHIRPGESLEEGLLKRLSDLSEIGVNRHTGFWQPMDTYRELVLMNELWDSGNPPWLHNDD